MGTLGTLVATIWAFGAVKKGFLPTEDWSLDDPAGQMMDAVREIRDSIRRRVEELVEEMA